LFVGANSVEMSGFNHLQRDTCPVFVLLFFLFILALHQEVMLPGAKLGQLVG
jgi:hypothetical protein